MRNKIKIILFVLGVAGIFTASFAAETYNLTIKYSTVGTVSGYDHHTKLRVFTNDKELGESTPKNQTIPNSVTVKVPIGSQKIKAVLLANYDNIWEERTVANDYSFDCIYEKTLDINNNKTIELVFNFNDNHIDEKSNNSENKTKDIDQLAKVAPKTNTTSKSTSTNNYQSELKKLNDYLKILDGGYYGYYEVKGGYIYERFKAGKYNKFKMEDIEGAIVQPEYFRVIFKCKNNNKCIETDWKENGREEYAIYSSSSNIDKKKLATLLNDFKDAYLGNKNNSSSSIDFDNLKSNIDITASKSTTTNTTNNYKDALDKLNKYLKTFDNGYYGYLEIKDGYLYDRFPTGKYTKTLMSDLGKVEEETYKRKVRILCKNGDNCVYSTYTNSYHPQLSFSQNTDFNTSELITLFNNLKNAYFNNTSSTDLSKARANALRDEKNHTDDSNSSNSNNDEDEDLWMWLFGGYDDYNNSSNNSSTSTKTQSDVSKYGTALKNLNDYLKIFNPSVYKNVEVKNGKVYFNFITLGKTYSSYIDISSLKQNTTVIKSTGNEEVKILCKNSSNCFYSEYSKSNADHFRFYSNGNKDLVKMEKLVNDFIKAL
ncbi:MAG: hypothetical protein KDD21_07235 [Bacteroidetes bacterium]|nr:hypothetical protein [Bacteroidota bacterium]